MHICSMNSIVRKSAMYNLPSIVSGYCRKTSGSTTNRVSSTTKVNLSVIRRLAATLVVTAPLDTVQQQ